MTDSNTIVIIGGGHNGLVCAAYLAKAGKNVTVLEASEEVGGAAATREFAPGYKASCAHLLNLLDRYTQKLGNTSASLKEIQPMLGEIRKEATKLMEEAKKSHLLCW